MKHVFKRSRSVLVARHLRQICVFIAAFFRQIGAFFVKSLCPSNDPIIYKIRMRSGRIRWCVYDPVSERKETLDSVEEVRIWLEDSQRRDRSPWDI
jgi:hypothetical protein